MEIRRETVGERQDLSAHRDFLVTVIEYLRKIDPDFVIFTEGPWFGFNPMSFVWRKYPTGGYIRGVTLKTCDGIEGIYVRIEPTVYEGTALDDSPRGRTACHLIAQLYDDFNETPYLLLADIKGETWSEAWTLAKMHWEEQGKEIPDFSLHLD